jgi:Restriction endonuclease
MSEDIGTKVQSGARNKERTVEQWMVLPEPLARAGQRGVNLRAALAVLADGKPRTAKEIVAAGIAGHLLPHGASSQVLYVSLTQYLARAKESGRLQLIVQDSDRRFRTNHPIDDWPEPAERLPSGTAVHDVDAHESRLHDLAHGDDPAAFERAVCEAFDALGFVSRHIGGQGAPDGVLEAPLGRLAYRVMLECKTSSGATVPNPDAAEAAKWRESYAGDYAMIIGPSFAGADSEFMSELDVHRVSAWSVDDLVAALRIAADPDELRAVFAPGFAEDHLPALVWERTHGRAKRVAVTAQLIREVVWRRQVAVLGHRDDAPVISEDAAMVLVDEELEKRGSTAVSSRDDVRAAFAYLTSPLVRAARWLDDPGGAIVALHP